MVVTLQHNDLTIKVFDDSSFIQSPDSLTKYEKVYQPEKDHEYVPASQHAIVVYKNGVKLSSAILLAAAGATSVTENSIIIENNNLITRCCNIVFSLTLPDLQLNWMTEVDWATCFAIHKYHDDFITEGEMSITRINRNGKILWEYSGADIFVTLDGSSSFDMYDDYIALSDFNGSTYKIDYNGMEINYVKADYYKQKPVKLSLKSEKPWWKFW